LRVKIKGYFQGRADDKLALGQRSET